jgi:hypothetical protein
VLTAIFWMKMARSNLDKRSSLNCSGIRFIIQLSTSDADDIVTETLTFQKVEEDKEAQPTYDPSSSQLSNIIEQALHTNEALASYLDDTARENQSVSPSDSLGIFYSLV